jgi:hypothetical protein
VVEVAAGIAFFQWHAAARHWVAGAMGPSLRHAVGVVRFERVAQLFVEPGLQRLAIHTPGLERLAALYYGSLHLGVPLAAAVFVRARRRDWYRSCRRAFVALFASALPVFWLWPLAPPRMLPAHYGFVDVLARDVHLPAADHLFMPSLYNGVAAMPSLHVGFALWAVIAVWPLVRSRRLRTVVALHPVVMLFATVATGNHFVLDGLAGAALAVGAFAVEGRLPHPRLGLGALTAALLGAALVIWLPTGVWSMAIEDAALAGLAALAYRAWRRAGVVTRAVDPVG